MRKTKLYFTNQTIDRHQARKIELEIEAACPSLELENPFYDGDAREVKSLDTTGVTHLSAEEIVGMDLRKIRESQGILAYMTNDRDIGSCMEIAIGGHGWGKPIYVIATTEQHFSHPWLQYFATKIFSDHHQFIVYWNSEGK